MYVYEGKDYSKEPSREDKKAFDQLLDLQKALIEETSKEGRALRNKANVRHMWQGTRCSFICLWKIKLGSFLSLPTACRRHVKRFGCQCTKVGSGIRAWQFSSSADRSEICCTGHSYKLRSQTHILHDNWDLMIQTCGQVNKWEENVGWGGHQRWL